METVAVFSESDRDSMHVQLADQAVCIGPPPARRSYLDMAAIIAAARGTGADAIHPGYGFLAENADFAALCRERGITFVGPAPESIRLAGDKVAARETARRNGVPVVPGSDGAVTDAATAMVLGADIGFPLLLKARAGGGGRGMRVVRDAASLESAWLEASREAAAAFGDGGLYMERYLERVRHVEVQVLADQSGRTVALGERDCSVQRRHQKLVEEAPSPALTPALRKHICQAAIDAARSIDYVGAGTVEFLFDVDRQEFHFIEMNARIQVEHPVTEVLTGVDLVAEQLRIASGKPLSIRPDIVALRGHAIECRINAEDPDADFAPRPGTITVFRTPGGPGVRLDTHCYPGYAFPPHYDSLLGKLIVYGADRAEALARMRRALGELVIEGIPTTASFHRRVMNDPEFVRGTVTTAFLDAFAARSAAQEDIDVHA